MRQTTRLAGVAAAAAALLLGSATTAVAQSGTIDDKRYDVLFDEGKRASTGTYAQRVASSGVDADKLTVNHGQNFVSIRFTFHKLVQGSYAFGDILVNGGPEIDYGLGVFPDEEGGIEAGIGSENTPGCSTSSDTGRITGSSKLGTGGFIQLYVPRSCLGNPKTVRFAGTGVFFDGDGAPVLLQQLARPGGFASVQAEPTNEVYYDPISAQYYGKAALTPLLVRN